MDLPVVNHKDYFAKIGDDHKFPINKFGELANYLIKKKIIKKFHKPYPCSEETLRRENSNLFGAEELPDAVNQEDLLDKKKQEREKLGSVNLDFYLMLYLLHTLDMLLQKIIVFFIIK